MTPLEVALERIEACQNTQSKSLDLSELDLKEIPPQVFELNWLEKLDISGSWGKRILLSEIPEGIKQLENLIDLNVSCTSSDLI